MARLGTWLSAPLDSVVEEGWLRHLPVAMIALLAMAVYANSFPGIFVMDDFHIVVNNPLVQSPEWGKLLHSDYWGYGQNTGLYRPLTIASLALNRLLFGAGPAGFHLVNVLLHVAVSILALRVLTAWGFPLALAWLSAALFAVHPIHTEVVDQAVGRSELLVALFLLLALLAAAHTSLRAGFWVCFCFLLALLAKEHAFTLILILPVLDAFSAGTWQACRRRWRLYLALGTIAGLWLAWRQWGVVHLTPPDVVRVFNLEVGGEEISTTVRVLTALKLQWLYLAKLVAPVTLYGIYQGGDFPGLILSLWTPAGLAVTTGFLLLLAGVAWGWRRRAPAALFGLLYMAAFSTTANLFFPIGATFAERLAYFPSLWYCAAVAALFLAVGRSPRFQRFCWGVAMVYLLSLTVRCVVRNIDYASTIALWRKDVANNPLNVSALSALAESLATKGELAEAEQVYRQTFRTPGGETPQALRSWSNYLLRQQRYAEAIEASTKAVDLLREYKDPEVIYSMGHLAYAYAESKQYDKALYWMDQGGTFYRDPSGDWDLRGRILEGLGRYAEAATAYAQVTGWPPLSDGPLRYGLCLFRIGRLDDALNVFEAGLQMQESGALWNGVGVVQAQKGNWQAAAAAFVRAVQLEPADSHYQDNLKRAREKR